MLTRVAVLGLLLTVAAVGCTPARYGGEVQCPGNSTWDGDKCVGALEPTEPPAPTTATEVEPEEATDGDTAIATGPAPGSDSITGDFVGDISVGGQTTRVDTQLRSAGGTITGSYMYAGNPGQFSNCQLSDSQLTCTWTEAGMTGGFSVRLASDGSSFSGNWDFSDGRPGGSWTGQRQGGAAPPPPNNNPASGSVGGTYKGRISVNGRLGPVVTRLSASGGVVSGDYSYGGTSGQVSNCQMRRSQLTCTWTEGAMTGGFRVAFSSDLRSFSGSWDFSDGTAGGSWDGAR
jgi:hypothetical protein